MERSNRGQIPVSPLPRDGRAESNGRQPDNDQLPYDQRDMAQALTLLGLGIALEGADRVTGEVRKWKHSTQSGSGKAPEWLDTNEMRYALIGLLFEAEAQMQRRIRVIRQARTRFRMRLARAVAPIISRIVPIEVALTGIELMEMLEDYRSQRVQRWTRLGRIEETEARDFTRHAMNDWVDEGLAYFARNPAVRDLIMQQGGEFATSALDEIRANSASVDSWFEEMTRRVLRRPAQRNPKASAEQAPANEQAPSVEQEQAPTSEQAPRVALEGSGA